MNLSPTEMDNTQTLESESFVNPGTEEFNAFSTLPSSSSDENYRLIFENAVMGIYQSTPEGRHISVNPALAKIYGYDSPEELISTMEDIAHQLFVDPNRRTEFLQQLKQNGECSNFESPVYRKDGEIIWISENARTVRDQTGRILFIVGTVKDITEHKQAIEQMRRAKEEWERTFDAIDDIVTILDGKLHIRRMNRAASENFEAIPFERPLDHCSELFYCRKKYCKICPAWLTVRDHKPHSAEIENIDLGKSFQMTTSPIFNDDHDFVGVVLVAKDITEQKKLRQESEYRLQQVIQADKLKSLGAVVAGVAHEINNPNSFIVYNTRLLEDSWRTFEPVLKDYAQAHPGRKLNGIPFAELVQDMSEIIRAIDTGSQRIHNSVESLKDFARPDESVQPVPVYVNEAIEKALDIIGAQVRKSVKSVTKNLGENLPPVQGHFQKIEQVAINLIVNAAQSILRKEEGKILISTRYVDRLKSVLITVEDNGRGMEPDVIKRIFEPFYTTRRDSGGTGLGLSVSYEIVRRYNGIIGVMSRKDLGTRFTVILPVNPHITLNLQPTILCIDCEEQTSRVLKVSLPGSKIKFLTAKGKPQTVINYLEKYPEIDVILMSAKAADSYKIIVEHIRVKYPLPEILIYTDCEKITALPVYNTNAPFHIINKPLQIDSFREIVTQITRQKL